MAPLLVLLQAHLCGERRLAVGTAVTQLLSYGGLVGTETSVEGVKRELPPGTQKKTVGGCFPLCPPITSAQNNRLPRKK